MAVKNKIQPAALVRVQDPLAHYAGDISLTPIGLRYLGMTPNPTIAGTPDIAKGNQTDAESKRRAV